MPRPRLPSRSEIITCARIAYDGNPRVAIARSPVVRREKKRKGAWVTARVFIAYESVEGSD
jgi:hypothetical protein